MHKLVVKAVLALFMSMNLQAQSQYEEGMQQAFLLWQEEKPTEAANLFERIAKAEKEKWLPYYYASQVKIVESFPMTDVVKKEQLLKEAEQLLNEARAQGGDEVELLILQAMLNTAYLTLDPATYGMKLSPVINQLYATAAEKAPDNPRVVASRAEWNMGSARFFGEDPSKYCPELQRSLDLFAKEKVSKTVAPAWGENRARMLISQSCGNEPQAQK